MNTLAPGQIIAGKFRLRSLIGKGGMGSVWLAEHLSLGSEVAIKFIDPAIADKPSSLRRFKHEAEAAARLRSAHVVQVLDYGLDGDVPYLVMERLLGESLRQRLERDGRLDAQETMHIVSQVCKALDKAHEQGIVHRDVKPDNIFLTQEGGEIFVKVLDFGIAKAPATGTDSQSEHTTATGTLLGSPQYMSPEQAHGAKEVDRRSDLWSLAVVVFECITGTAPFNGSGWGELVLEICRDPLPKPSQRTAVPDGFDAWFERAAERDVERRFGSAQVFAQELACVLTPGRSLPPPSPTAVSSAPANDSSPEATTDGDGLSSAPTLLSTTAGFSATDPPKRSTPRAPMVLALILLAVGGAFGWWSLFSSDGLDSPEPRQTVGSTQRPTPKPTTAATPQPKTSEPQPTASSPSELSPAASTAEDPAVEGLGAGSNVTPAATPPTPTAPGAPRTPSQSQAPAPAKPKATGSPKISTPTPPTPPPSTPPPSTPPPSTPPPSTPPPASGVLDRRH